jgi:hypothetical protein
MHNMQTLSASADAFEVSAAVVITSNIAKLGGHPQSIKSILLMYGVSLSQHTQASIIHTRSQLLRTPTSVAITLVLDITKTVRPFQTLLPAI